MSIVIGEFIFSGKQEPLPRNRGEAKRVLRKLAKSCGVERVSFVRAKHQLHGGFYHSKNKRIGIVEQYKSRKIPIYIMAFRLLHELVHHVQCESHLFAAFYYQQYRDEKGKWRKFSSADRRRVALRAERHADRKASELAWELFGLAIRPPRPYPKEFLQETRKELLG